MEIQTSNDVKVYNLSAGKSLPEWISDRKKRTLLKNDLDLRRRIELLQDFTMPVAATGVAVSTDGQYIFTTGIYKPRVRCYDVAHLSMKFERCLDAQVVDFSLLSEDYTKFVLLLANRQLEFHSQFGVYYRTRVPKFGRSLAYHTGSCDLYIAAEGSEVYRLNLEQGKFLSPLVTKASGCNVCRFNSHHQLMAVGTDEGTVECWDPRSHCRVGELPLALAGLHYFDRDVVPAVTALEFKGAMTLAVGTASGQVLLYDLRSPRPHLVKDHLYASPIHTISFQPQEGLVLSADSKILKIWNEADGSAHTSIEPQHGINQVKHLADTGLILMAMDDPKLLAYYVPSVGVAPKWCSFLDNLTEELEEDPEPTVYQDYKFVTSKDLDELGLSHLLGTNLLRAYMHGYFMDVKLYHKAKAVAQPFAYEEYRKERIRQKIEEGRASKIRLKKLPKVNRKLAEKLLTSSGKQEGGVDGDNPLQDARFSNMFTNPDFEVDEESEAFQRLHPLISHRDKKLQGKKEANKPSVAEEEEELEGKPSDAESSSDESDQEVWKEVRKEAREKRELARQAAAAHQPTIPTPAVTTKLVAVKTKESFSSASLGQRLEKVRGGEMPGQESSSLGSKELTFTVQKTDTLSEERHQKMKEHGAERRRVRRSASSILPKRRTNQPVYWKGRRVK